MSVNVRQRPGGGWTVDIRVLLTSGERYRERRKLDAGYSKTTAREWSERRARELLLSGPRTRKEVPTLEAFAPRFVEGYARANRQKPSGIAASPASPPTVRPDRRRNARRPTLLCSAAQARAANFPRLRVGSFRLISTAAPHFFNVS